MPVIFKKETVHSRFLDPSNCFAEKDFPLEIRTDPLTKHAGIVCEFPYRRPEKANLSQLVAKSLELGCPFCPEVIDQNTPKFTADLCPEGRIHLGEATVFPNIMPYMAYSAVAVLSHQHFVALSEFTEETLSNGFLAAQTYLKCVVDCDPRARYLYINWNYMPPAASTIIHPHLQILVGYSPATYQRKLEEASQQYYQENETNFWPDLIREEERLGERYIARIGDTIWLTSFVPRSWQLDIMVIFRGRDSILTLSEEDWASFCRGLSNVFSYMSEENFYSFNLSLYSGMPGQDHLWTQARIIQRSTFSPIGASDCGSLRLLLDQSYSTRPPEVVCQELRKYF